MSPQPTRPTLPLAALDLARLAEVAELRAATDHPGAPCLLRVVVVDADADIELGWRPLPAGRHPLDELVGFTAPADWEAVGVVAHGVAHWLDDDVGSSPPARVRTTHLVSRDGSWALRCDLPGRDAVAAAGRADDPDRVAGRLDDACRRVLGLPTTPPDIGTGELFTLQWLDAVVAAATTSPDSVATWPAVVDLHPTIPALLPDAGGGGVDPAALAHKANQLAEWRDWPVLRRACAAGTWSTAEVDAAAADWLDDGAFSRWVLGGYPDVGELVATCADLLPQSVMAAVTETVALSGSAP